MDVTLIITIVTIIALVLVAVRFGKAMNELEQKVSDIQDRLDGKR